MVNDNSILICPETKIPVVKKTIKEAEQILGTKLKKVDILNYNREILIDCEFVLLREDKKCVYSIIEDIPILLCPEKLVSVNERRRIDVKDIKYREAYEEMSHYNNRGLESINIAEKSDICRQIDEIKDNGNKYVDTFPDPKKIWIDALHDCLGQWDAYNFISPVNGKRILQLGGSGSHAVKFLLAGASEAWLLTPMLGEIKMAMHLAEKAGVKDMLKCVVGIAEEIPFKNNSFDAIYSGGCAHHFYMDLAMNECSRVLKEGGKIAMVDPWKHPLYSFGIKLFGKREVDVHCKPFTDTRIKSFRNNFSKTDVIHHGHILRYLFIAASKFRLVLNLSTMWKIHKLDDIMFSWLPYLKRNGGSVALLGEK